MSTTAIFAELVVGGSLTLTWMVLFAATLFEDRFRHHLMGDKPYVLAFGITAAYTLGVVFDRVWELILERPAWEAWLRKRSEAGASDFDRRRWEIYARDPATGAGLLDYTRSRMRVARAALFNFFFIGLGGLAFLGFRRQEWGAAVAVFVAFTLLSGASLLALRELCRTYDRTVLGMSEVARKISAEGADNR
jgi:hypothetical protein